MEKFHGLNLNTPLQRLQKQQVLKTSQSAKCVWPRHNFIKFAHTLLRTVDAIRTYFITAQESVLVPNLALDLNIKNNRIMVWNLVKNLIPQNFKVLHFNIICMKSIVFLKIALLIFAGDNFAVTTGPVEYLESHQVSLQFHRDGLMLTHFEFSTKSRQILYRNISWKFATNSHLF